VNMRAFIFPALALGGGEGQACLGGSVAPSIARAGGRAGGGAAPAASDRAHLTTFLSAWAWLEREAGG